jgi:hypothetical protein
MRYKNKFTLINSSQLYKDKFLKKGVNFIEYEQTPDISFPDSAQSIELDIIIHNWKMGDRLYKLAHRYYGDPTMWWVIAFYNAKPTESYYTYGTQVEIPKPLDKVLQFMGY